jgi:hypothetical protein
MKSFSKIVFGFLLLVLSSGLQAQSDGPCCDINSTGTNNVYAGPGTCNTANDFDPEGSDGVVCDPDCDDYNNEACTTIPLDGGLSLLAIAGGGLATAAMRRRREEELLEKEA